jgi:hypothetical protein
MIVSAAATVVHVFSLSLLTSASEGLLQLRLLLYCGQLTEFDVLFTLFNLFKAHWSRDAPTV